MVQRRNGCDEIEAVVGERVSHHITLDKGNARVRRTGSSSARDDAMVGINRDDLLAMFSKPTSEQACAASDVESTPGARRNRTQYEIVIVNIVIPWTLTHALLIVAQSSTCHLAGLSITVPYAVAATRTAGFQ
jgi:hypothetical protein